MRNRLSHGFTPSKGIALAMLLLVGVMGVSIGARWAEPKPSTQSEFSKILDGLSFENSDYKTATRQYNKARKALSQLGTNALPLLLDEVRHSGIIEVSNRFAAGKLIFRIDKCFKVLTTNAEPILPELIEEFRTGRAVGAAASGLKHIGGTQAGLTLVSGLTNEDRQVRNISIMALSGFSTNPEVARSAAPLVRASLSDPHAGTRASAARLAGALRAEPELSVAALTKMAETDPNPIVKRVAIASIGRFGTNAISAESTLEKILETQEDPHARRIASNALMAVHGQMDPTKVR